MRDTFNSRMDAGKAVAADRRSRGFHTGKAAKGWNRNLARERARSGNVGPGTWDHCLAVARAEWKYARGEAIEAFRFAVHGDQWEGL